MNLLVVYSMSNTKHVEIIINSILLFHINNTYNINNRSNNSNIDHTSNISNIILFGNN